MAISITFLAGLSIIVGALISKLAPHPDKIGHLSMSLALGSLSALLFFDLLPELGESSEQLGWVKLILFAAAGFVILMLFDGFIPDHHDTKENHDHENAVHIGLMSSVAVILHNILEGMTVYSLALSSTRDGLIFSLGIALHNIPMGMLIYSTMNQKNRGQKRFLIGLVTLSTLAGGVIMMLFQNHLHEQLEGALLCLAAGMIIYIVFTELLPHVLRTRPIGPSAVGAVSGFLLVFLSCQIAG